MTKSTNRTLAIAVAGMALALLAGCQDSGTKPASSGSKPTTAAAPDAKGAVALMQQYLKAFDDGDGAKVCALMTPSYQAVVIKDTIKSGIVKAGATCVQAAAAGSRVAKGFGLDLGDAKTSLVSQTGNTATVLVTYQDSEPESYRVVFEQGVWRLDGEVGKSEADTKATTNRWLANWCSVKVGQTRKRAIALMGEPTTEYTVSDDATPQLNWELGPYHFTAFLDTDAMVNSFFADYSKLGKTDRAKLKCPESR